ncbi:hypothetical protein [Streptomyces marianii]|uniref:hypothetical protein n=1 Tax=Streptomyces marianii TaxID=1817406 RepID=UPI002D77BB24|nr:hypothetical protein [Streptomyces marianii]
MSVVADGEGLIGHAGAVLLRRLADRTGLTSALAAVLPAGTGAGWRDRAVVVVVQLAVAIVLGAANLSDAEQLQAHRQGLFGPAVSDSTTRRTLVAMDEEVLAKIAWVRARVRRHIWSLLHLRPGGFPWLTIAGKHLHRWVVIDMFATIITAASKKEGRRGDLEEVVRLPSAGCVVCEHRRVSGDAAACGQRRLEHGGRPHPGAA